MSIILISSDNVEREVSLPLLKHSKFIKETLEKKPDEKSIKLEEINSKTLDLLVNFLTHFENNAPVKTIPETLKSSNLKDEIDEWYADFISNTDFETTFHLINAGMQLNLDYLHSLACARIASFMMNKSPEEVNKEFTIECQLTTEEAKNLGLDVDD